MSKLHSATNYRATASLHERIVAAKQQFGVTKDVEKHKQAANRLRGLAAKK